MGSPRRLDELFRCHTACSHSVCGSERSDQSTTVPLALDRYKHLNTSPGREQDSLRAEVHRLSLEFQ